MIGHRWALKWQSDNILDGHTEFFMGDGDARPLVFRTRQKAREYAYENFGYIGLRDDLRREPFGWKRVKVVKVSVDIREM